MINYPLTLSTGNQCPTALTNSESFPLPGFKSWLLACVAYAVQCRSLHALACEDTTLTDLYSLLLDNDSILLKSGRGAAAVAAAAESGGHFPCPALTPVLSPQVSLLCRADAVLSRYTCTCLSVAGVQEVLRKQPQNKHKRMLSMFIF